MNRHARILSLYPDDEEKVQAKEKELREDGKSQLEIEEEIGNLRHKYGKERDKGLRRVPMSAIVKPTRLKLAIAAAIMFSLLAVTCIVFIILIETTSVSASDTRTFWQREKMFILWGLTNVVFAFIMIARARRMDNQFREELEALEAKCSGFGSPVTPIVNKKYPNRNKKNTP